MIAATTIYLCVGTINAILDLWDDPEAGAGDWIVMVLASPVVAAAGFACGVWQALTNPPD